MTRFEQKIAWLRQWVKNNNTVCLEVLNKKLVDDYEAKFNVKVIVQPFGANTCRDLGRTLSKGYKDGLLERGTVSISDKESGFPNWVYAYNFKP